MEKIGSGSKNRERQGEKLADFFIRIDAFTFFKRLKEDTELSNAVTFDEFKAFLIRINGILRNIPITDRGFDGEGVVLNGFIGQETVPRQEDKEGLLAEAFMALTHLKYPEDGAYMLPTVLTAAHPFADGNGRTSRVLHLLLTAPATSEEFYVHLNKALGVDGSLDTLDLNPSYIKPKIQEIILKRHGITEDQLPDGLTRPRTIEKASIQEARNFFEKFDADPQYCFVAMYTFLNTKGTLESVVKTKSDFPNFNLDDRYKAISPKKMEEIFTQEDWNILLNEYYKIKRESVEILIDLFVNPDEYKSKESGTTLRELLIEKAKLNLLGNKLKE